VATERDIEFERLVRIETTRRVMMIFVALIIVLNVFTQIELYTGIPINALLYIISLKIKELPLVLSQCAWLAPYVNIFFQALLMIDLLYSLKQESVLIEKKPNIGVVMTLILTQVNLTLLLFFWTGILTYGLFLAYYVFALICTIYYVIISR